MCTRARWLPVDVRLGHVWTAPWQELSDVLQHRPRGGATSWLRRSKALHRPELSPHVSTSLTNTTRVSRETRRYESSTSSFTSRMHPEATRWPMVLGEFVP